MTENIIPRWDERTNHPGYRNTTTTRVAAKYFSMGLSHNEVIFKLFDYNKQHNSPPLDASEIFSIANHFLVGASSDTSAISEYDKGDQCDLAGTDWCTCDSQEMTVEEIAIEGAGL